MSLRPEDWPRIKDLFDRALLTEENLMVAKWWLPLRSWFRDRRGVFLADDFLRDLTHGARLLWRNPGFAAVVLATLAIALGTTVTVFSSVDAWLPRPLNFPDADRLVIAFGARPERPREPAVWMPYRAYRLLTRASTSHSRSSTSRIEQRSPEQHVDSLSCGNHHEELDA